MGLIQSADMMEKLLAPNSFSLLTEAADKNS